MYGAILGDMIGSPYEFDKSKKTKEWRRILSAAALNKADILIPGAFGCGAFYNPPQVVVQAFGNVFHEFARCFEVVKFAVFAQDEDDPNYRVFSGMKDITPVGEEDHGKRKGEAAYEGYLEGRRFRGRGRGCPGLPGSV